MENTSIITKGYVHTVIKKRERDIHKGDCGKVLAVAAQRVWQAPLYFAGAVHTEPEAGLCA